MSLSQKDPSIALTPPMGWNSWNVFAGDINEEMIRKMADVMVSSGMKDAGYIYVNIDDNWMAPRRDPKTKRLVPDPVRFPNGIKSLADYVHSKGLKLGIYGDRGTMTCLNVPESGSQGFEEIDAKTFAEWEVDLLKFDNCNAVDTLVRQQYQLMSRSLRESGRKILFSVCEWGENKPTEWAPGISHMWRTTPDITDAWPRILKIANMNEATAKFATPGGWNDPDMLEVGNGGCTYDEYKTHFSLWCIMAAPLITGCNLAEMSAQTKEILLNKELIAIDQDSAGLQGYRVRTSPEGQVWVKHLGKLMGAEKAVVLFNPSDKAQVIKVEWTEIGLQPAKVSVRDMWEHRDKGQFDNYFSAEVPSHGCVALRVKGIPGEWTKVPNLSGILIDHAGDILKRYQLKTGNVNYIYSEEIPKGYIVKQSEPSGKNVYANTSLDLTISKGKEWDQSKFLVELWRGHEGKRVPVELIPDKTMETDSIFLPAYYGDVYGVRIRGYFSPQKDGAHTFSIAANDHGELWLSDDSTANNKKRICYSDFAENAFQWNKSVSQKSKSISLSSKKKYYMEVLLKENWSEDFLNVAIEDSKGNSIMPIRSLNYTKSKHSHAGTNKGNKNINKRTTGK